MRKTLLVSLCALCFAASQAVGQWTFVKAFPDSSFKGPSAAHGIAVDGEGKIWIQPFGARDSIFQASTQTWRACRAIYVFNPDGTPVSFSPIKVISGQMKNAAGTADSSFVDTLYVDGRGLRRDHKGDILISQSNRLYKVNHKTGAGIRKVLPGFTLTAAAVSNAGEYFVAAVVPPQPIRIYDENFNILGNVVDSSQGFSRAFIVSPDGNDVYWAGYTLNCILKYHSNFGTLGPYVLVDTLFKGISSESFDWDPKTGRLWLSSGNNDANPPNNFAGVTTSYSKWAWYGFDLATKTVKDSILWNDSPWKAGAGTLDARPRGIAFSKTGDTAWVVQFNASTFPMVLMFRRGAATKVEQTSGVIPTTYELSQNYPNPFNPSTKIRFQLGAAGQTSLRVYDVMGREVRVLVNEHLEAGVYTVSFDASSLPSGTYIYVLTSGSYRQANKMILMK